MSRRRRVIHKEEKLDGRYHSPVVARLISTVMQSGKKSLAERIVYTAIEETRTGHRCGRSASKCCNKAIDNVKPRLEVKSRRVGGATYQVPMEVPPGRQLALAMRWIVSYAQSRKNIPLVKALASELKEAANGQGNAIKKRDDTHKMAQANRAFAHFRFLITLFPSNDAHTAYSYVRRHCSCSRRPRIPIHRTARIHSSGRATSALPRTLTQARPRSPSASSSTPA